MNKFKTVGKIAAALFVLTLVVFVCFTAVACGGVAEYSATKELTDSMSEEEKAPYVSGASVKKLESVLVVDGDSYTLIKTSYAGAQTDEALIDETLWYTSYQIAFRFEFKGTCSKDGEDRKSVV